MDPSDVSVIAPDPGRPGETPTQASLTMTNCHPPISVAPSCPAFVITAASRSRATRHRRITVLGLSAGTAAAASWLLLPGVTA